MSDFARTVNSATLADINRANAAFHGQTADQVPGKMATEHQQAVEKQKHIPGSYESGASSGEHALNRVSKAFRKFEKQHGRKPDHGEAQALLSIEGQKDDDPAISMTQATPTFGEGAKKLAAAAAKVATKAAHFGRAALAEQKGHKTRLALSGRDEERKKPEKPFSNKEFEKAFQSGRRSFLRKKTQTHKAIAESIERALNEKGLTHNTDVRHPEGPRGKTQQTRGGQVVVQHDVSSTEKFTSSEAARAEGKKLAKTIKKSFEGPRGGSGLDPEYARKKAETAAHYGRTALGERDSSPLTRAIRKQKNVAKVPQTSEERKQIAYELRKAHQANPKRSHEQQEYEVGMARQHDDDRKTSKRPFLKAHEEVQKRVKLQKAQARYRPTADDHFPATQDTIKDVNDRNKAYYESSQHAGMAQDSPTEQYAILKQSEGGEGVKQARQRLAAEGIKSSHVESPYIGHSGLQVSGSKRLHKKVSRILYGK